MAEFSRSTQRLACSGLFVSASADVLPPGKYPFLLNARSYVEDSFVPRMGLTVVNSTPLGQTNIHSVMRLNDSSAFATNAAILITGAGGTTYYGVPSANPPAALATGFSGNPLSFAIATPPQSPRPYLYIGDSAQTLKTTTDGPAYTWGLAPPAVLQPRAVVNPLLTTVIDDFTGVGGWAMAGAVASNPTTNAPVTTTISTILYDSGSTGWALINLASMINVCTGMRLRLAGGAETAVIQDIKIQVAPTTIAAIAYDSGSTGICSVVPTGSLGTGQTTSVDVVLPGATSVPRNTGAPLPTPGTYSYAYIPTPAGTTNPALVLPQEPSAATATLTPQQPVNFPVDCLITIGGEAVRILSVQQGRDGTLAFRCSTVSTHAAGAAIVGLPAIRVNLATTRSAGDAATVTSLKNLITPVATTEVVGGIQNTTGGPYDLALLPGSVAVLDTDVLHLSLKVDVLSNVTEVRVYLDVNNGATNFLTNYYMAVWSANDLVSALQTINAGSITPLNTVQQELAAILAAQNILNNDQAALQLALGDNQWISLSMPISSLIRVGSDTGRTLANVAGVEILLSATAAAPLNVEYSSLYIAGGGQVDIGATATPIIYWYRYRSPLTGAVSNPSPALRGGVIPRQQSVALTAFASGDPQATIIDFFRQGGTISTPTYVGSTQNGGTTLLDNFSDSELDGGEPLDFTQFQPWPTQGGPVSGLCTTVGSTVLFVSGSAWSPSWPAGTSILINGLPYTLYSQPTTSMMVLVESAGAQTSVPFYIAAPTQLAQPLRSIFSGSQGGITFTFAVGDPNNPGTAYWTNPNNAETTSDTNTIIVTDASEPLLCGWWYDGIPYVLSTEQIYALMPNFGAATGGIWHPQVTPCGRGGWTPWAWCQFPDGVAFLAKDGVFFSSGSGGAAQSLTDPDLRLLFPHDGGPGVSVSLAGETINPPDMTQTSLLRLAYCDGWLYFDFKDTSGASATLAFEWSSKRWFYDRYAVPIQVRDWVLGQSVHTTIVGSNNGILYTMGGTTDGGTAIPGAILTHMVDLGDPRIDKQWGDYAVNVNAPVGAVATVTPYFNLNNFLQGLSAIQINTIGPQTWPADIFQGLGLLAQSMGLLMQWTASIAGLQWNWWQPSYVPKIERIVDRATDWDNLGTPGAKYIQGIIIRANTFNVPKLVQIQGDGGVIYQTFAIQHNGEESIAYPLASTGWVPFTAHLVRVIGADNILWQLYASDTKWVFEPAPEAATEWAAQPTTCDLPGYFSARDFLVAYNSTSALSLTLAYDGVLGPTYPIPSSGGIYARYYVQALAPLKGRSIQPVLTGATPFQLFKRDCVMRVTPWGASNGYIMVQPFGGQSRADGAAI